MTTIGGKPLNISIPRVLGQWRKRSLNNSNKNNKFLEQTLNTNVLRVYLVNKNELISAVADSASITKTDAAKAVDAVFSTISTSLGTGTEVRLTGFGTFTVTSRKATTGRNPRTGEAIQIPASKLPKFRPGKTLRESVN